MSDTDKPDRIVRIAIRLEVPGQETSYWEVSPFPISRTGEVFGRIFAALEDKHSVCVRMLDPADKPADVPFGGIIKIDEEIETFDDESAGL